jgi:hypothetical protein
MRCGTFFILAVFLYLGVSADCRADECDDLSNRVTRLNNEVSKATPSDARSAVQFSFDPNESNKLYCPMYDLNVAKAKLYRTCYQELGYTKLRAEEYARRFDSDAASIASYCSR